MKAKNNLTMKEHMHELKVRLLICIITILLTFTVCVIECKNTSRLLVSLGEKAGFQFIYSAPQDAVIAVMKSSLVFAVLISVPVLLIQIVLFVMPVFNTRKHKALMTIIVVVATALFLAGMIFAYKILLPIALSFMCKTGVDLNMQPTVSLIQYIDLVIAVELCIGLITELPIVTILLNKIGILSINIMRKIRKYIVIVSLIVGAIITPPDIVSQVLVAVPLIILYEISIVFCMIFNRKSKGKEMMT